MKTPKRMSLRFVGLASSVALLVFANGPSRAQTAEELESSYRRERMEQALQTKQHFDLYGVHFDFDKATIQPNSKELLDDIATALKNFPDWRLRIVGHTDSTGDSALEQSLVAGSCGRRESGTGGTRCGCPEADFGGSRREPANRQQRHAPGPRFEPQGGTEPFH